MRGPRSGVDSELCLSRPYDQYTYKAVQGAPTPRCPEPGRSPQDDNQGPGFISGSRDPTSLKQRSDVVFHCPIQRQTRTRSCPVAEHLKVRKNQVVQMLLKQDCGACPDQPLQLLLGRL